MEARVAAIGLERRKREEIPVKGEVRPDARDSVLGNGPPYVRNDVARSGRRSSTR